ncbi:hypothetical protein T03_4667 [Trichinella britovi]|uniref:Uncharacterized protein n=1 Tax=Trichinella britovi TaxID=45882 RepID=A0A0V1AIH2_TRIBR|nr:hypothetical protein T03_4667 [Trichinella britovi]
MVILQTFNKPGGARRISTPMHTALLRSPHIDLTLPPFALQKGKRDAQVQFRGRRHALIQAATRLGVSAFLNMSAALSALGICRLSISPYCIFSFTKWCLMSMCRVLADDD